LTQERRCAWVGIEDLDETVLKFCTTKQSSNM
jgi:hypothetical protein